MRLSKAAVPTVAVLVAGIFVGSCRSPGDAPIVDPGVGRPCDPIGGGAECRPGLVCREPPYIDADEPVCCPAQAFPPGPCGSRRAEVHDASQPATDAASPEASTEGDCQDAFCPSPGVGTGCCVTPYGPCGADTGSGCEAVAPDAGAGPPPCGDKAPEGQVLVDGLHYPTLVTGSPPLVASHNETTCGSPMCTYGCGSPDQESVSLVSFDGSVLPPVDNSRAREWIVLAGAHVFWTSGGGGDYNDELRLQPLAGGTATIVRDQQWIGPVARDVDHVYWVESNPDCGTQYPFCGCAPAPIILMRAPIATGSPFHTVQKLPNYVYELVVGGSAFFFTTGDGRLHSLPIAGGAISDAAYTGAVQHLVLDADHVYFASQGATPIDAGAGDWAIGRVPQSGGDVEWITAGVGKVGALTVDDAHVYWTEDAACGSVWRVAKTGGTSEVVARYQPSPTSILVDDKNVYWSLAGTFMSTFVVGGTNPDGSVRWTVKAP